MRLRILSVLLFAAVCLPGSSEPGDPTPYIYGIHSWASGANGLFNGRRGWTVESVNTANYAFDLQPSQAQQIVNENFELILRINKEAGLTVPTNSADWDTFAADCATKVGQFKTYCHIYIIGNEMNADFEGNVPVATYIEVYRRCRAAIKAVQPEAIVAVGALAPWNASQTGTGPYPGNRQWLNYMYQLVNTLDADADAYAIHAYGGRGGDADPRDDDELAFGVYQKWMEILDNNAFASSVPVYLTEFNHAADGQKSDMPGFPKYDYPAGFINKAFEEINDWNSSHYHRISCACWFAYSNGGFPGYNISSYSAMQDDFRFVTQNTTYFGPLTAAHDWQLFR
jgi:hypothetical protein